MIYLLIVRQNLVNLGIVERDPNMRLKLCQFGGRFAGSNQIDPSKCRKQGFSADPPLSATYPSLSSSQVIRLSSA